MKARLAASPVPDAGRSRSDVHAARATGAVSMITEHGRATPLMWMTVPTRKLKAMRDLLASAGGV